MFDFVGFIIAKRIGTFIRWLVLGAKGSFKDFYTNKEMYFIDYIIGTLAFFGVMYLVIEVFKWW